MGENAEGNLESFGDGLTKEFLDKAMRLYAWFDKLNPESQAEYTVWIEKLAVLREELPISFQQLVEVSIQVVSEPSEFLTMSPKQILAAIKARPDLKTLPTGWEVI